MGSVPKMHFAKHFILVTRSMTRFMRLDVCATYFSFLDVYILGVCATFLLEHTEPQIHQLVYRNVC